MAMRLFFSFLVILFSFDSMLCRDEEKIMKSCYWPNEVYEPCFGGCAEVSCDNPRNHLRPCYPYCEPGCVCEDPYVRDDRTHLCVLPQDCSPTQMGIPVPSRRGSGGGSVNLGKPMPVAPKYEQRQPRVRIDPHSKRDMPEIIDGDLPFKASPSPTAHDDWQSGKRAEMSRMGNYFNIVIAPPPIKPLQPRKLIQDYRSSSKRQR